MSTRIRLHNPLNSPGTAWLPALGTGVVIAGAVSPTDAIAVPLRWLGLMIGPGAALYLFTSRGASRLSGLVLSALALSPVLTALAGMLILALQLPLQFGASLIAAIGFGLAAAGLVFARGRVALPDRRSVLWLGTLLGVVVVLTAFLPMTREWWRIRSDAWFHAAVVGQIADFGIPPEDPYFAGVTLQYMWFYHVVVLVLSRGLSIEPFRVMALINIQALLALGVATWMVTGVFRRTLVHRFAATAVMLLGFNGAFWVFLPVKLAKAMIGDVRGLAEVKRTYSLVPFTYNRATDFLTVYYNQDFFLDKFMVATAFGLSLGFMVAGWYGATEYLRTRRTAPLAILAVALVGMLGFHSLVGFVTLVGIFGGAILAWIFRDRKSPFPIKPVLILLGISLAMFIATGPYLYQVMHLKEKEQVFPLSVSLPKTIGMFISISFALVLFLIRRPLFDQRSIQARFYLFGALSVTVFCLLIRLPGPNTYDKLGYLVFLPLAPLAGIALADMWGNRRGAARKRLLAWTLAFMLPVNLIAFAACFATPDATEVTAAEARLSTWLRENTPRNALIIDDNDRVVFLVTAPRRYLWGCWPYAQQWGYPKLEMSRRLHARRALYSRGKLDATTLEVLGGVTDPLYVVVRPENIAEAAVVVTRADLFEIVYQSEGITLVRVNTGACREQASGRSDHISPQELIRESGL